MVSIPSLPQHSIEILADSIIDQIDTYRGEMSRLELLKIIIHHQLRKQDKEEELYRFIKELIETLGDYLELICEDKLSRATAISR